MKIMMIFMVNYNPIKMNCQGGATWKSERKRRGKPAMHTSERGVQRTRTKYGKSICDTGPKKQMKTTDHSKQKRMQKVGDVMDHKKIAYNITEAAAALSLSRQSIYKLIASDPTFPAFHIGKSVRVSVAGLQEWVSAQAGRATI